MFVPLCPKQAAAQTTSPTYAELVKKVSDVLPSAEEDAFLQIPWRLNVMQARAESLRTGKPLLIWEMNGNPLGHT